MNRGNVRGSIGRRPIKVLLAILVALVLVAPFPSNAWIFPYDPIEEAYIKEVGSWAHPDGGGSDLYINFSYDHSMLLLVGYGTPGEVRVMDRNMTTLAVLEPPHEGFMAKGASWAEGAISLAVWGRAPTDENDTIAMYDVPSFTQNTDQPWIGLVDLPQVDSVDFYASNVIMSVAGRDAFGTSRLLFIEVNSVRVHRNIVHPGNHTIVTVGNDGGMVIIADSGGNIDMMSGGDWTVTEHLEGVLEGGATAWYIPYGGPWAIGGAQGRVVVQEGYIWGPTPALNIGPGPIQGFTWTMDRQLDLIAAIPRPEGGSRLVAWQAMDELSNNDTAGPICHLNTTASVTMMEPEPGGRGRVLVAFDDGTLGAYRLVIRPRPTELRPGDPDEPDGKGLEAFRKWRHESGEGDFLKFAFNHQGSLILLRGYASLHDIRVVNRTMGTVAILDPPFDKEGPPAGTEWSSMDRYLVLWGDPKTMGGSPIIVYDVPSFRESKDLDLEWIMDHIDSITSMEFLPGDDTLAVGGIAGVEHVIMVLDLAKKKVLAKHRSPDGEEIVEIYQDGNDLLAIAFNGTITTFSPPDWNIDRTVITLPTPLISSDVHGDSGWLAISGDRNLTVFTGDPRAPVYEIRDHSMMVHAVAWTLLDGDFVLSVDRPYGGTSIQLWQTRDRPRLVGVQPISQINTTKLCVFLAGDPANPGLFAAGFNDGTFALYSLNLTPYPPPPEELAGEDIGPINGTGNGNQGNGGVEPQTLGDFAYLIGIIVVIAILLALLVWLKRGEDEAEED